MTEGRNLDRLLLPRLRGDPEGADLLMPESSAPLPRWQTVPLDAKFPVTPAPKGDVTFVTTRICHPAYRSSQHENFDLTDPYNRTFKLEYQALSDPYLKDWFSKPYVRKQLLKQNLLTPNGNVTCTVRDFNNYRNYMRHQALIKSRESQTSDQAAEKRKMMLAMTKMKAELVSVGVKCKGLKAQQMHKEAEEEKQRQFIKKQAFEIEREQKRQEDEKRAHSELVQKRRAKWEEKQIEIKRRRENLRKQSEEKGLASELETLQKLNNVDHIRQQRQYLLDLRRKEQWQQKREHQIFVLDETKRQQERVEADIEIRKRLYEEKMTKAKTRNQAPVTVDVPQRTEEMHQKTSEVVELNTSRMSLETKLSETRQIAPQTRELDVTLSRRASIWILEEVLYSFGLVEEANLLFNTQSQQAYTTILDNLIGSAVRRIESASALGQEQDNLSKIIHLVVRRLDEAYPGKEEKQLTQEADDMNDDTTDPKRLLPEVDYSLETEKVVHISMCATMDVRRKLARDTNMGVDRRNKNDHLDYTAKLFANHLRLSEWDVRKMEAELNQYLVYFQMTSRTIGEEKDILELFLKLVCHEPISASESYRQMDQSKDERLSFTLENMLQLPTPGSYDCAVEDSSCVSLRKGSRISFVSGQENLDSDLYEPSGGADMNSRLVDKSKEIYGRDGVWNEEFGDHGGVHQCLGLHLDSGIFLKSTEVDDVSELHYKSLEEKEDNSQELVSDSQILDCSNKQNNKHVENSDVHSENMAKIRQTIPVTVYREDICSDIDKHEAQCETLDKVECIAKSFPTLSHRESERSTLPSELGEQKLVAEGTEDAAEIECSQRGIEADAENVRRDSENKCEYYMKERSLVIEDSARDAEGSEENNCGSLFLPSVQKANGQTTLYDICEEAFSSKTFADSGDLDDIVTTTADFLMKMQHRELVEGVGLPPSKIHYLIGISLSRMWQSRPSDSAHVFGNWVDIPDVAKTIGSLLQSVKTMRFPGALLKSLTNTIATAILQKFTDRDTLLSEGLVTSIAYQFLKDLEVNKVSSKVLEHVLLMLQMEYSRYLKLDLSFKIRMFLWHTLSDAENILSTGEVTNQDFTRNILDFEKLSLEAQTTLLSSSWKVLIHQTKVAIQLSAVSKQDNKKVEDVVMSCGKLLTELDEWNTIQEYIDGINSRQNVSEFQVKAAMTISANLVAALLKTVTDNKITCMTLLPGAVTPHTSIKPSKLDHNTPGEALVLLVLDSLVRDVGEDTLNRDYLGHLAASLVSIFTSDYNYQKEALEGDGLAGGLECMTSRLRCKSLEFKDSCKIMSGFLRPYMAFILLEDIDVGPKLQLGDGLFVDDDLLSSLIDFITQVFFTFVRGVVTKIRDCGVGASLSEDVIVLYVWRSIAALAKEAKALLCDQYDMESCLATTPTTKKSDCFVLKGFVDTLVNSNSNKTTEGRQHIEGDNTVESSDRNDKITVNMFMRAVLKQLPDPGYITVPEHSIPSQTRQNESMASNKIISREELIIPEVVKAARIEIIQAAKLVCQSLITKDALHNINVKMADYVVCSVFVMERFITKLYEKVHALKTGLQDGDIAPTNIIPSLLTAGKHILPGAALNKEAAISILTEVVLELEPIQRSVSRLCKLVENISKINQKLASIKGHTNSILSAVPVTDIALLIRSIIVFTLRSVAWLLDGACHENATTPKQTPVAKYEMAISKASFHCIQARIESVRKLTAKENNAKRQRRPRNVAGTSEELVSELPIGIREKVMEQVSIIFGSSCTAAAGDDDDRIGDTPPPTDIVAYITGQILQSVTVCIKLGTFPFLRINDILRNETPTKIERPGEITKAGGSCTAIRSKIKVRDPLGSMELDGSECLLRQLFNIMTSVDCVLKEEMSSAVKVNESYDSLQRASALVNVKLGTIKNDSMKKNIVLSNIQPSDACKLNRLSADSSYHEKAVGGYKQAATQETSLSVFPTEVGRYQKISISSYTENLFINLANVERINKTVYVSQVRVIKDILKACFKVGVEILSCGDTADKKAEFSLLSVLVVELITAELYKRLDELKRARTKELDKGTNYPYLFSRKYTTPDPWGPYYSDVAVRARHLSETLKSSGVARSRSCKLSTMSSLISNIEESPGSENSQGVQHVPSVLLELGSTETEPRKNLRRSYDVKGQARVVAWRKRVKNSASVHSSENTIKSWVKTGANVNQKPSETQQAHQSSHLDVQRKDIDLLKFHPVRKYREQEDELKAESRKMSHRFIGQRSNSEHFEQNYSKSHTNDTKRSLTHNGKANSELDSSDKQTDTKILAKSQENVQQKLALPAKTWKLNEEPAKRHIERMSRAGHKSKMRTKHFGVNVWPRTVHIIHHAYADHPSLPTPVQMENNCYTAETSMDDFLKQISHMEPIDSQNNLIIEGIPCPQQTDLGGATESIYINLLISFLTHEMPQETAIISQFLHRDPTLALEADGLVDLLSLLDLAMIELDDGNEVGASRLLKGQGRKDNVSQRAAGAINNLLRSMMNDVIGDKQIQDQLIDTGNDCKKLDLQCVKHELITRLSSMAEKVEKGFKIANVLSGQEGKIIEALRQFSHEKDGACPNRSQEDNHYDSDTDHSSGGDSHGSCKIDSGSSTLCCDAAQRSISISDDDSNDDKCVISSSWTILSSCPSLSSSLSSNVVNTIKPEDIKAELLFEQSMRVGDPSKKDEERQQSGRTSKAKSPGDHEQEVKLSERGSKTDRVHHCSMNRQQCSRNSNTQSDYSHNQEWQVSGISSNTDSAHSCNRRCLQSKQGSEDESALACRDQSQNSRDSSCTSTTKTSRSSTTHSSHVTHVETDSAISISPTASHSSEQRTIIWTRCRLDNDQDRDDMTEVSSLPDNEEKIYEKLNHGEESSKESDRYQNQTELSEGYSQLETKTLEISDENGPCNEEDSLTHTSGSEGESQNCSRNQEANNFQDLRGGGDVANRFVEDYEM